MSDYKSWEQRQADAALTKAQAEQAKVAAEQARVDLAGNAAAAQTKQMAEQLKQQRLQQQMAEQQEAGKDRADLRRHKRVEERADSGHTFKILVRVFVAVCMMSALPAQFSYFLGLHKAGTTGTAWLLGPLPIVLELAAWVAVYGTAWAGRKGMSKVPFWILTASLSGFAAWINYSHGSAEYGSVAGKALAAASFAGPLMWELSEWLDGLAAVETRTREQRAADRQAARTKATQAKRVAEHEAQRAKLFPAVHTRFVEIVAAHPLGTVDREKAWAVAWTDIHRAPLGVTAETYQGRAEAEQKLQSVMDPDGEKSVYKKLDAWLWDTLGGDDEGDGGLRVHAAPKGPQPGPSQARKTLGGKGREALQPARQSAPEKALDPAHVSAAKKLAKVLAESGKELSTADVKKLIGGGRTEYLVRVREAAIAELDKAN